MIKLENQSISSNSSSGLTFIDDRNEEDDVLEIIDVAENSVMKKIKIEEGIWKLQQLLQDPLSVLGSDIMHMILSCLDARSAALCLPVSRGWNGAACTDRVWSPKCDELWLGKAHVPRLSSTRGLSKLHIYSLSVMDGRRTRIRRDDLCDHAWQFHFSEAAPIYYRNLDPFWMPGTGDLMRRYFHQDGSQTADLDDKVWGGHEACYSVVTGLETGGKIREHYVRINRWPGLSISRKQDWGWEMSNHLFSYSSVPDPGKEHGTGPAFEFC